MADDLELDLDLELEDRFDEYIPQPPISTKKEKKKKQQTLDQNTGEESHNPGVIEVTDVAEIQNEDIESNEANQNHQEHQVDVGEQLASQFGYEENSQISASYNQENYNPLVGSYQVDSFQESLQESLQEGESPSFCGHVGQGDANFSASLQGLQSFDMSRSLNVGGGQQGSNGQNLNQLNKIQALKPSLNGTVNLNLEGTGALLIVWYFVYELLGMAVSGCFFCNISWTLE